MKKVKNSKNLIKKEGNNYNTVVEIIIKAAYLRVINHLPPQGCLHCVSKKLIMMSNYL